MNGRYTYNDPELTLIVEQLLEIDDEIHMDYIYEKSITTFNYNDNYDYPVADAFAAGFSVFAEIESLVRVEAAGMVIFFANPVDAIKAEMLDMLVKARREADVKKILRS